MAAGQGAVAAHLRGGEVARQALALPELVIGVGRDVQECLVVEVRDLRVAAELKPQAQGLDLLRDHVGPPDQDRRGEALVHHHLRGAQHAIVLALGVGDALGRRLRPPRRTPAASPCPSV